MRGEVYRLKPRAGARGHEQTGARYGVVVQSDHLPLSTWLMAPTSTRARATSYRPTISVAGTPTRVLVEQLSSVDPFTFAEPVAHLAHREMHEINHALAMVLGLD